MESEWGFAAVLEAVADRLPDAPAVIHGQARINWRTFDERANSLAGALLAAGLQEQDKVAQYLYNCPEYLESVFAAFKGGLAIVNTNYRYTADELHYLWDNADVAAVVFHGTFTERCEAVRSRLSSVKVWLWVDDGSGPCPDWAVSYRAAAGAGASDRVVAPWGRSGDHLVLLYTGGTTGMPKGVMWRQHDLFWALEESNRRGLTPGSHVDDLAATITTAGPRLLPAAPYMHATGLFTALGHLALGGSATTLTGHSFDPVELLDTVARERITSCVLVGDAFAKPIVAALDAEPERWELSSLRLLISSGVMFARETKAALLRHVPSVVIVDTIGSSEAMGIGSSRTSATGMAETASFRLGERGRVVADDGSIVEPGSGIIGRLAVTGFMPLGYYKDPVKTASTFTEIDGIRYSLPGDLATVDADGTVRLLGRGSQCINTGGEKVYPEEVEEALKLCPGVLDAAVVGVPDDRFGEMVCALVELQEAAALDTGAIDAALRRSLASYKVPRRMIEVQTVARGANGKLDYRGLREQAIAAVGIQRQALSTTNGA